VKITRNDDVLIHPDDIVKVTKMNHVVEVQHMDKMNHKANIKKLDKNRYLEISTGEIKEFQHSENRQQNYNSLRQTFKRLRHLITHNFTGKPNELFVTLTYREDMKDTKRLYKDFDKFMKRIRYKFKDETTIDQLNVVEPHASGKWHCHLLLRFNELDRIYMPNEFDSEGNPVNAPLYELWGQGWVRIKSLKNVDNIGAYLSAYLADAELTEENYFSTVVADGKAEIKEVEGKKFIKGGRLHMYPSGMNIYRKSKGIVEPEPEMMKFKHVEKVVGSAKPHYQKAIHIENGDYQSTISYLHYNTKRR
jgi:hypothetical protein